MCFVERFPRFDSAFRSNVFSRTAGLPTFAAAVGLLLGSASVSSASTACSAAWSASTVYTGSQTASEAGINYTAAYWTQGNEPAKNNGPAGSGKPWISAGACGGSTTPPPGTQPPANPKRIFAPYVDMGTQFGEGVEAMQQAAGLKAITLAFLVGPPDGSCSVGWGGYANANPAQLLPNDTLWDGTTVQSIVTSMQSKQVNVIIAFGGASGPDPAYNCSKKGATVATLQKLYQSVIDRYHVTMLDFDIEPIYWPVAIDPEADQASLTLRDKALAGLKTANPKLVVSYTLPVTVTGLDAKAKNVITSVKNDGLALDVLNIMAMDYGRGADDNGKMGQAAVDAATNTKANLNSAGLTKTTVGIIPMIGENDPSSGYAEYFYLTDVTTVLNFAKGAGASYISRVGMWSLNRDSGCAATMPNAPTTCSGISQSTNAFSLAFGNIQ